MDASLTPQDRLSDPSRGGSSREARAARPGIPGRHPGEARRLSAVSGRALLGTAAEDAFEEIAALAGRICGTPIAAISFLVGDRTWLRSGAGLATRDAPLVIGLCAHVALGTGPVEIADLTLDPRTAGNPLVTGAPGLRFCAGVPVTTADGLPLGALCVLDTRARALDGAQRAALRTLARQVTGQLDLRRALRAQAAGVRRAEEQATEIARSIEAAETLRLEIDHRVKNSLQLVSSLLQMQASRSGSEEVRDALASAGGRVRAISSIHAALNRSSGSSGSSTVRLREHAERLVEELRAGAPDGVEIALAADEIVLRSSEATSLAILVNEFVTNSLKHAFPDGREGRVSLDIRRDGDRVRARFSDDGVGHAAGGRSAQEGLGTRIMHAVGQQLGATLDLVADVDGTSLAFDFPLGPDG